VSETASPGPSGARVAALGRSPLDAPSLRGHPFQEMRRMRTRSFPATEAEWRASAGPGLFVV
jgi:hypothetical protein